MEFKSQKLRDYRALAGLTQVELAEKVRVTNLTVHRWETGQAAPHPRQLKALARVLKIETSDLVSMEA